MARRTAARGTWRPRKRSPRSSAAGGEDDGAADDARPAKRSVGEFFCCYLLRSLCQRLKGRTYIGFTVNPRRRIRQHNGEISSGAWRTRRGRPWEMVLCIHGFPTDVAALQFEWAWQHPKESLAVRKAASGFKSLSGAGNKVKLAYAMLNLPSWENLNLTVNFFSSTSAKFAAGCPSLPSQMKTIVCPLEDLQCHAEAVTGDLGPSSQEDDDIEEDPQGPSSSQEQPVDDAQTRTAGCDVEKEGYSSDDFALMERDGILDLTEPVGSRTSPQCSLRSNNIDDGPSSQVEDDIQEEDPLARQGPPDCDEHSEHSWKQSSSDQVRRRMDAQTRTAVCDVEEDGYSGDESVPMQWDGVLDLTELDGLRTSPQCSLSSGADGDEAVQDEMWKVSGDCGVVDGELQQTSPVWKACAGSDGGAVDHEPLGQASPVLKVGTYSDCGNCGITKDELRQSLSPMLMVDAGTEEGEWNAVVDLVTPTPVGGRLRRRAAGAGSICNRIIDLTASPVIIEL